MKRIALLLVTFILLTSFIEKHKKADFYGQRPFYGGFTLYKSGSKSIQCKYKYVSKKNRNTGKIELYCFDLKFSLLARRLDKLTNNNVPKGIPINYDAQILSESKRNISFDGTIHKAILEKDFVFMNTNYEIFILEISSMQFIPFLKRKERIIDFAILEEKLFLSYKNRIEVIDYNKNTATFFEKQFNSLLTATTDKKHLIILEVNENNGLKTKKIMTKEFKEKLIIKNSELLKNLIDIPSNNRAITFNDNSYVLSVYNLRKELKLKEIKIPTQSNEEITAINIINYDNYKILAEITYKNDRFSEKILTKIDLKNNTIENIVDFEIVAESYEYNSYNGYTR